MTLEGYNMQRIKCADCKTTSAKKYVRGYCIICYNRLLKNGALSKIDKNIPKIITNHQLQIINGLMLGDGHLERRSPTHNTILRVERSIKDEDYLRDNYKSFEDFCASSPRFRKKNGVLRFINFATRSVPVFNHLHDKWYNKKTKIVPSDINLTPLTCAIWFCDDGFFHRARGYLLMKLCTHSFTFDEVERLANILSNKLCCHFSPIAMHKDESTYYTINGAGPAARNFYDYIQECFPLSMSRKIDNFNIHKICVKY